MSTTDAPTTANEELLGAIARGWCAPENVRKEMDADLAQAILAEIRPVVELLVSRRVAALAQQAPAAEPVEWQASVNEGKSWRMVAAQEGMSQRQRVDYLLTLRRADGSPAYLVRALYAAPQPPQAQPLKSDARKLCTCDGAGMGAGRACVVKAGGRLGDLWCCAKGAGAA